MSDFDYKNAFIDLMEMIDGSSYLHESDVKDDFYRQYWKDTGNDSMLNLLDEDE